MMWIVVGVIGLVVAVIVGFAVVEIFWSPGGDGRWWR